MLKKLAIIYILLLFANALLSSIAAPAQASNGPQYRPTVIPDEAIRLRILANSDRQEDQEIKRAIRDEVNASVNEWVGAIADIKQARQVVADKVPEIEKIAQEEMEKLGINQSVDVSFGMADFPTKMYGQMVYPAGSYEAIVISLGDAEGANWWCVLFPPLCFLDFANSEAVPHDHDGASVNDEREVKFFIVEWIEKCWAFFFG
ncbi:stage II sporulation protein R [Bacillaceae bacterium SIJ1]|uniref:stage II sporulation protein R n=1 Tax=Litoribacterium kuwaitense TaxID=1398745 RepID=UPI0013EC6424|nr:stage II sporulation protein R [Litoribacterium kuwaitense]NGP44721.1 stage II sporulation protein R [Litoribacterium kuwaitense]